MSSVAEPKAPPTNRVGLTVKEYQTKVRAHRAMELLRDSDLKITDIAHEVGMVDLAYFSRIFKKQYQLSPRQLRQQGQLPDPGGAAP